MVGIALAFGASCSSTPKVLQAEKPKIGNIIDYFPGTPGLSLMYDFTSSDNPSDNGKRSIIFQKPAHDTEYNFKYTALNTWAGAMCLWKTDGEIIGASASLQNAYWDGAFRYFFMVNMPAQFKDGMEYSVQNIDYQVKILDSWNAYRDCISISFNSPDNWGPPWEQGKLSGTGCFILAKGIGLVQIYFTNRATNSVEVFNLAGAPKQLEAHRIFGHIQDSAGSPLPDVYVSLASWLGMNWWGKSDSTGDYSFEYFCEQGWFQGGYLLGYDLNKDNLLRDREVQSASEYFSFNTADIDMGTLTAAPPEYVKTEVIEYEGHHYQIIMEKQSWQEAIAYCQNTLLNGERGHLVSINDAEENDFIWQNYTRLLGSVILGASDEAAEGTWVWLDGSDFDYENWAPGEPNNYNNEDYVVMNYDRTWNDIPNPDNPRICEWDK